MEKPCSKAKKFVWKWQSLQVWGVIFFK